MFMHGTILNETMQETRQPPGQTCTVIQSAEQISLSCQSPYFIICSVVDIDFL